MQHSSDFCRNQEALQVKRAAETDLSNVRQIATAAAQAWAAEALAAEKREDRHSKRQVEDAAPAIGES